MLWWKWMISNLFRDQLGLRLLSDADPTTQQYRVLSHRDPLLFSKSLYHAYMTRLVVSSVIGIAVFLTASFGSALITFGGEQPGSTDKWTAWAAEARKRKPVAVSESSRAAGEKIYVKPCVTCHGKTTP